MNVNCGHISVLNSALILRDLMNAIVEVDMYWMRQTTSPVLVKRIGLM